MWFINKAMQLKKILGKGKSTQPFLFVALKNLYIHDKKLQGMRLLTLQYLHDNLVQNLSYSNMNNNQNKLNKIYITMPHFLESGPNRNSGIISRSLIWKCKNLLLFPLAYFTD
jgi:hypothetical protein